MIESWLFKMFTLDKGSFKKNIINFRIQYCRPCLNLLQILHIPSFNIGCFLLLTDMRFLKIWTLVRCFQKKWTYRTHHYTRSRVGRNFEMGEIYIHKKSSKFFILSYCGKEPVKDSPRHCCSVWSLVLPKDPLFRVRKKKQQQS